MVRLPCILPGFVFEGFEGHQAVIVREPGQYSSIKQ